MTAAKTLQRRARKNSQQPQAPRQPDSESTFEGQRKQAQDFEKHKGPQECVIDQERSHVCPSALVKFIRCFTFGSIWAIHKLRDSFLSPAQKMRSMKRNTIQNSVDRSYKGASTDLSSGTSWQPKHVRVYVLQLVSEHHQLRTSQSLQDRLHIQTGQRGQFVRRPVDNSVSVHCT